MVKYNFTNQEAIDVIKNNWPSENYTMLREALEMAIVALSKEANNNSQVEELAAYAHRQWSGWMEYLFSKCSFNTDGTATIPEWAVDRWQRQIKTEYKDLSEDEKESDRKEARGMLQVIANNNSLDEIIQICEKLLLFVDDRLSIHIEKIWRLAKDAKK